MTLIFATTPEDVYLRLVQWTTEPDLGKALKNWKKHNYKSPEHDGWQFFAVDASSIIDGELWS